MTAPNDMLKLALESLPLAYAPYSKFHVAACVRTKDGNLFSAVNVENTSYPLSSCAEKNAIIKAVSAGERQIIECLVLVDQQEVCTPCGGCRQCLYEFAQGDMPIHLCTTHNQHRLTTLQELLPLTFKFSIED